MCFLRCESTCGKKLFGLKVLLRNLEAKTNGPKLSFDLFPVQKYTTFSLAHNFFM